MKTTYVYRTATPKGNGYRRGVEVMPDVTPPAGWVTLFDDAGTPWGYQEFSDSPNWRQYGYMRRGSRVTLVEAYGKNDKSPEVRIAGNTFRADDRRKIDALRLILNHAFDWAHGGA